MEVFRPELHAYGMRAWLEVARESLGASRVAELLARYGVSEQVLNDPESWLSLEFVESWIDDIVTATGDPQIIDRAARLSLSRKYLGPLYTWVRAFGTPSFAYSHSAKSSGRHNKTGNYDIEFTAPTSCTLRFTPATTIAPERTTHICRMRAQQLAAIPMLFDLPPATIAQPQCILRGDSCCRYDITWIAKRSDRRASAFTGLGAGVIGAAIAIYFEADQAWVLFTAAITAISGWAVRKSLGLERTVEERVREIAEHHDALARSMQANEQRFSELLEAKAEVEKKVELRTKELQQTSRQLSETLNKVQELDRAKTDFFNNVSHELRSPLTLILAPLEELLSGRAPTNGERGAYESMHRNASRLLRLINQLLDLAKIDAGEMKINVVPIDLVGLLRASLKAFEGAAIKKGVNLTLSAPDRMPPISLDPAWIDSAVTNLVANALRLTKAGGGVRVTVEDFGSTATIAVSDDGPGIAPADQQKVFERFAQGDSSKRVVGGTGIGLALVREATRLHGGDVQLSSELGVGSTFTLSLPRRAIASTGTDFAASAAPAVLAPTSLKPSQTMVVAEVVDVPSHADRPGPNPAAALALVVEDNAELRIFIADALSLHYRVRAAGDGFQGFELARRLVPDVIVSDVAMPEMDGYELCRRLRAQPETKNVPVLLVTARTELASVLQGFDAGANDYLLKPFHTTELLARVDVHVRLRRLTAQLARQERLAALGSLAASVAHNVRNPLSALISGLPAMRNRLAPTLDPSTGELMGIMVDCAERIERMTLDLLDLSRIDREVSGDFAPGIGLLACTRMFAARVGPELDLVTDIDTTAVASGRAGDINHVFMNVIDNALRAVSSTGRIEVRGEPSDGHYVVTVADSGDGIDAESIDRIFEPFWTTRAAGEGTGLGLSIARQIVEEHSGTITAGRSPLGGALFTLRLPLRNPQRAVA